MQNKFNSTHLLAMLPAVSEDDRSHFLWIVLKNADGLSLPSEDAYVGEYHSKDGDEYAVYNHGFGYIVEVPKRETLNLLEWINDEAGHVQGRLNDNIFEDYVPYDKIVMVGTFVADVEEDADHEASKDLSLFMLTFGSISPNAVHLPNGDMLQLSTIDASRPGLANTRQGYSAVLVLPEGETQDDVIAESFPHLVKTEIQMEDGTLQYVWLADGLSDLTMTIN